MKKLVLVLCLCAVCLPALAQREDAGKIRAERDAAISKISAEVRDIEARYWAGEVLEKRTSLGALEVNARRWLGERAENERLLDLTRQYVRQGKIPALSAQELDLLDENKRRVREFLNDGRQNPAAEALARRNREITQIKKPVAQIEARHWAWRIAVVKDVTFEELSANARQWVGERSANAALMDLVEENLKKGNTAPLSPQEEKRLEEANKQVRGLFGAGH